MSLPLASPTSHTTHFNERQYAKPLSKPDINDSEQPLSPPNPSPSPVKIKLDDEHDFDGDDVPDVRSPEDFNATTLQVESSELDTGLLASPKALKRGLDDSDSEVAKKLKLEQDTQTLEPASTNEKVSDKHDEYTSDILSLDVANVPLNSSIVPAPRPSPEPDMDNLPENPMPPHQAKYALNMIKAIKRLRDANPFIHPVDVIKLNIPLYYNYIPRPMDLSTIERKIVANAYLDPSEITLDFNLMVANCIKFNGENSGISKMGVNAQAHFEKHMLNFPPLELPQGSAVKEPAEVAEETNVTSKRRAIVEAEKSVAAHRPKRTIHPPKLKELPYDVRPRKRKYAAELRFCNQTIKELLSKRHMNYNFPFVAPVDAEALNIPHYHEIVKEPMDLGTIQTRLTNNQFENGDEFERQVRLVFSNCYLFNPEGTDVNAMGKKLEAVFDKKWASRPIADSNNSDSNSAYSSDDDAIEPEISEAMLSEVPAIQFLENQLARMQSELEELKKEHLKKMREQQLARRRKKKSKRSGSSSRRRGSTVSQGGKASYVNEQVLATPVVTYEMKKQVSEAVPGLSDKKLQAVIKIIKDDVEISNEDEVELDMDQLEDRTVLKLHTFLFGKKAMASLSGKKKKKYQPSSNVDEMASLRSQLALFDEGHEVNANQAGLMRIGHDQESSDDDISSESSEEE